MASPMPTLSTTELARLEDECHAAGVLSEYEAMIDKGTYPRAAAMYALQEAAGTTNSDKAFCQGQHRKMERMSPLLRNALQMQAKQAGIDTNGRYFIGGLSGGNARDPSAWVTSAEDVMTIAKAKNLNVEGVLNRKAIVKEQKPLPEVGLAPDIVRQLANKAIDSDPALRERCLKHKHARHELAERIIEKHGKKKRVKKPRRLFH